MTKQDIIDGNKIIAEFMGATFHETATKDILAKNPNYFVGELNWVLLKDLEYHSSWDWLMRVVEKIEDLDPEPQITHTYSIEITGNGTTAYKNIWGHGDERIISRHNMHNTRLWMTWLVVVDFIKWYNEKERENN